ncbi:hypothetical protein HZA96_02990 [Candidatus Woesearchaeota archaeon]|nr:hypothetical protein [Candidatus Woesearchaeota archaeon]
MKKIIAISIMMLLAALIISACAKTTPAAPQQPAATAQNSDITTAQDLPDENEFSQPSVDKLDSDFDAFSDW